MSFVLLSVVIIVTSILIYRALRSARSRRRVPALRAAGATVVDVRTAEEFAKGNVPGSVNAPLATLPAGLEQVDRLRPVLVCCASGVRSEAAISILRRAGYLDVVNAGSWRDL